MHIQTHCRGAHALQVLDPGKVVKHHQNALFELEQVVVRGRSSEPLNESWRMSPDASEIPETKPRRVACRPGEPPRRACLPKMRILVDGEKKY